MATVTCSSAAKQAGGYRGSLTSATTSPPWVSASKPALPLFMIIEVDGVVGCETVRALLGSMPYNAHPVVSVAAVCVRFHWSFAIRPADSII